MRRRWVTRGTALKSLRLSYASHQKVGQALSGNLVVDDDLGVHTWSDRADVDTANVKVSTSPFDRIVVGGSAALEKTGVVTEVAAVSAAVSNAGNTAHGAYDRRPNALR